MRIFVQVGNASQDKFWFNTSNIQVACTDSGSTIERHVFTYDELVAEEQSRQMWAAIAIGLSGAANAMSAQNAGYSYRTGTYNGNFTGNIYSSPMTSFGGTYSGTYSERTYNPYVAQMAKQQSEAQTNQQLQALAEAGDRAMQELGRSILRHNTVSPGQICGGVVEIESPIANDFGEEMYIYVTIDGEIHAMRFRVLKAD